MNGTSGNASPGSAGHQPGSKKPTESSNSQRDSDPTPEPGWCPALPGAASAGTVRGWYRRGFLPHYDAQRTFQAITFRLADALPQERLAELAVELATLGDSERERERRRRIEGWLDAGMGCCALRHPRLATVMQTSLQQFDGQRYHLIAWCIMPNHVHVLIQQQASLATIVGSWKSYTGRFAMAHNRELGLGIPGRTFWMREYWDRYIRDEPHFMNARRYIEQNPVQAGLCATPAEWRWSSAFPGNASAGNASPGSAGHQPGSMDPPAGLVPSAPREDAPRKTQ